MLLLNLEWPGRILPGRSTCGSLMVCEGSMYLAGLMLICNAGLIDSKASQVRAVRDTYHSRGVREIMCIQRYNILKEFPKDQKRIEEIADKLFNRLLIKEEEAVGKLRQVIEFATEDDCE
jgi:hypothetical protein